MDFFIRFRRPQPAPPPSSIDDQEIAAVLDQPNVVTPQTPTPTFLNPNPHDVTPTSAMTPGVSSLPGTNPVNVSLGDTSYDTQMMEASSSSSTPSVISQLPLATPLTQGYPQPVPALNMHLSLSFDVLRTLISSLNDVQQASLPQFHSLASNATSAIEPLTAMQRIHHGHLNTSRHIYHTLTQSLTDSLSLYNNLNLEYHQKQLYITKFFKTLSDNLQILPQSLAKLQQLGQQAQSIDSKLPSLTIEHHRVQKELSRVMQLLTDTYDAHLASYTTLFHTTNEHNRVHREIQSTLALLTSSLQNITSLQPIINPMLPNYHNSWIHT